MASRKSVVRYCLRVTYSVVYQGFSKLADREAILIYKYFTGEVKLD